MDMVDILTASAARDAESHDALYSSFYWNISQNASKEKHKSATPGIAGCISPGGDFLLPHQGRSMLGCKKLLIQGIPYFRLALGNETEVQLGDLAGNAMSLTVISACMLAAMVAPQLRDEVKDHVEKKGLPYPIMDEPKKKRKKGGSGSLEECILEYLKQHAGLCDGSVDPQKRRVWTGEIPTDSIVALRSTGNTKKHSSLSMFQELATLAPLAVKSSIWCTCESSGSNSHTNMFLQCKVCGVSCCRNCICATAGYNLESHETMDVVIGDGNSTELASDDNVRNL